MDPTRVSGLRGSQPNGGLTENGPRMAYSGLAVIWPGLRSMYR